MGNNAREKAQRKKKKQKMQPLKAQTGAFHDRSRSGVRKGSSSSKPMAMAGGAHRSQRACPSPTVPFDASHRILLVGEGDFSFAESLLVHHGCTSLLATSLDSASSLLEKYPQAVTHIHTIEAEADAQILHGVDATKLGRVGGGGKEIKKNRFDRIVFNFPHVGGKTKDVNRQVRYNQELLVGFFKAASPLLAPSGCLVVTIFEGDPYELWNIRDLARHVGLAVDRSFRFQVDAYPGYKHARTLGNIEGEGVWKGENRPARTYIFQIKDGAEIPLSSNKLKRPDSDDEDD